MLTLETFKTEFAPVNSPAGVPPSYHNSVVFPGHGDMCDVYFDSIDGEITQKQIDCYNQFLSSCKRHLEEVDRYILDNLSSSETKRVDNIRNAVLRMDVIDIKYDNPKYDFLVLYGKSYTGFLFLRHEIAVRAEFRNGVIQSMRRKGDFLKDNDAY